jgi:hypothetical protein
VTVDDGVHAYLAAIERHRELWDRVHRLALEAHPGAEIVLSYGMPTFVVGERRLHVGVWRHGLSFYGWAADRDAGFTARHPDWAGDRGTLKLRPPDAASVDDDELREFLRASLAP